MRHFEYFSNNVAWKCCKLRHFWWFFNCIKTSSNFEWHTFDFQANLTYGSLTADDTFSFCLNRQSLALQRCSLTTQETQKYKTSHWFVTHCQNMLMLFLDSPHPPVIFVLCTATKSILHSVSKITQKVSFKCFIETRQIHQSI